MEIHPEALTVLPQALVERIASMTTGVKVEPNAPIDGEVDL